MGALASHALLLLALDPGSLSLVIAAIIVELAVLARGVYSRESRTSCSLRSQSRASLSRPGQWLRR
jgi:hypothetical protein